MMKLPAYQVLQIVQEWHLALNNGNKQKLAALVWEDVTIGGPRGTAQGVDVLLEWVDRAGVTLTPQRYFRKQESVIVEELGEWHAPGTGEVTGSQAVATLFIVKDGRIASMSRYSSLPEAFAASGLQESDEVKLS